MSGVPWVRKTAGSRNNGFSDHRIEGIVVGRNVWSSIGTDSEGKDNVEKTMEELTMFMCCAALVPFEVVNDLYFLYLGCKLVEYDEQKTLRALADFICSVDFPPPMVKDITFKKLALRLNPLYNLTYGMVRSECMKVYEERKLGIKEYFGKFDGQISLSVDILRSDDLRTLCYEEYICLSAHFIDENWKLRKWVLYFRRLLDSSDDCLDEDWGIFKSLEDWGIVNKISTLTTTNGRCYALMFEYVKSHVHEKKELQLSGQMFNAYCCGEIISQMVQDVFEEISDIIDKVFELYTSKSLPLWYLTSFHLKEALKLWSIGEFSSKDVTDSYNVPSPEEWKIVEGVCKIVESIYEVSNALFETKHLTPNVYLYHLHDIREILTQLSIDSDSFIRKTVEGMLKKFVKYLDDMFLLLAVTAAMDPRFKMKYVEFVCLKVKGEDGISQVATVLGAIHKLFDEYVIRFPENENFMRDSPPASDSEGESPPRPTHVSSVLPAFQQFIQLNDHSTKRSDLECYLEEPVFPWSQDFDVLTWWRTAGSGKYPTLSRMARDLLAIPVSLASSFEAFYTQSRPVDERLVCLKPDLRNALICTRSWYEGSEMMLAGKLFCS